MIKLMINILNKWLQRIVNISAAGKWSTYIHHHSPLIILKTYSRNIADSICWCFYYNYCLMEYSISTVISINVYRFAEPCFDPVPGANAASVTDPFVIK